MELNMETGYASQWQELLAQLAPDRRRAMEFLRDHLPLSDLDCYPAELFLRFADHALALRETAAWCRELEEDIFNHYVLFPRVNDEDLSFHREIFRAGLWPRVKDLPGQEERALEVNRWCHEHACYQAQDERTASPLTVFRCGSGRCGEESAFLVSALRSVGIPARQVYAPRWSHCDDNHAWVEVLCGDVWRFLGACEPEPGLDRGWFITAASRAMLVHSRIFGQGTSPLHGEPLGREGAVCWLNQTPRYALTRMYAFRASADGKPASGARFRLQVLNESSFHTIAVLTADSQGTARVRLGLGSLHVSADWKGLSAEADCEGEETVLCLTPPETADMPWLDFDFRAPAGGGPAPAVLSAAQKAERAETLRRGNALRAERAASLARPEDRRYGSLLRKARGNAAVLRAFLNGSGASRRERLVRTLSEKDLRDVTLDILEDHFAHLPPCPGNLPEEIYWRYVACPRAALEPLTPWRGALSRRLSGWQGDPALLWSRLEALLERPRSNLYGNLYWTPVQALEGRRTGNLAGRRISSHTPPGDRGTPAERNGAELGSLPPAGRRVAKAAPRGRRRPADPPCRTVPAGYLRAAAQRESVCRPAGLLPVSGGSAAHLSAAAPLPPGGSAGQPPPALYLRRDAGRGVDPGSLPPGRTACSGHLAGGGRGAQRTRPERAAAPPGRAGCAAGAAHLPAAEPGEPGTPRPGRTAVRLEPGTAPPGRLGL
ncbi:MAG: hypothetical protein HFF74_06500 [Oscillospiraceae bacterium]|nr:hypothetical protein [Oscillospiraceae bacterium]